MRLRDFTSARVELGQTGHSLRTRELMDFQLAHARARDAVHLALDVRGLSAELDGRGIVHVNLESAAPDRATYLRHPDLGRQLSRSSRDLVPNGAFDAALIIADGLSALAVHRHAIPVLELLLANLTDWRLAPVAIVSQGRVAIGDEIGEKAGAQLSVLLIGERPGLSSPDSLGIYLTWKPRPGRMDAERNCISNVRPEGLSYASAAHKLLFLMNESRRLKLSGIGLKEAANLLP